MAKQSAASTDRGDSPFFPGFSTVQAPVNGTTVVGEYGGSGPPVLLLHGYPETHAMWHKVAPLLVEHFTVVCPDLRGYGDSGKPASDDTHVAYSKRAMAQGQFELMRTLGFERFAVVGHDRSARLARRIALDYPDAVSHLALLDIVPTQTMYELVDQQRATNAWRYFFLAQPPDLPELLIGADANAYLEWTFREWSGTPGVPEPVALAEYRRCFDAATIHATCEDYRAGATIDLVHDRADRDQQIACPVLVLWSEDGLDVLGIWREHVRDLRGRSLRCGHFLPEERPDEGYRELVAFLRS